MMTRLFKRLLKQPVQKLLTLRARSAVTQLTGHPDPSVRAIGQALAESLDHTLSAEEQRWIDAIEQRRAALLASPEQITVLDYGAGSPDAHRTREEMERGVRSSRQLADVCRASKPRFWATLLFKMIRELEPTSCVELGTCVGVSAAYQGAALALNGKGSLATLEGAPEIARIAKDTLDATGLDSVSIVTGPFHQTLGDVLTAAAPIDFFFNDGHHDHDAVMRYFTEALPHLADSAVMVLDDISWSAGMRKAWTEIARHPRVVASIDLRALGIVVIGQPGGGQDHYRIPLI